MRLATFFCSVKLLFIYSSGWRKSRAERRGEPRTPPLVIDQWNYSFKSSPIEPGLEIAGLGRAGYNTAGLYSTMIGEEDGHTYHALSQQFLRIIAKVGPAILRNYLGMINPPQRIVIYTPHGEMLFRLRNSVS